MDSTLLVFVDELEGDILQPNMAPIIENPARNPNSTEILVSKHGENIPYIFDKAYNTNHVKTIPIASTNVQLQQLQQQYCACNTSCSN